MISLSPAMAYIWAAEGGCRAFPRMAAKYKQGEKTDAQREGDQAHELAEQWLSTGEQPVFPSVEMMSHVGDYVRLVNEMAPGADIEMRIDVSKVTGFPGVGRADAIGHGPVIDLKYGHTPVPAVGNLQLAIYALATGLVDPVLVVYQPRAGGASVWKPTQGELAAIDTQVKAAAIEAQDPNAPATAGDHCAKCPALFNCEAAMRRGVTLFNATSLTPDQPPELHEVGSRLIFLGAALSHLKKLQDAYKEQAFHAIQNGKSVPGWALVSTKQPLAWTDAAGVVEIADAIGVDVRKPSDYITPTQAIAAGLPEVIVNEHAKRAKNKLSLKQQVIKL